ncbi:tetratricopeptide repeat protein [Phenylobacterium sp.]|uniref:tetratricopeptide repeat protein n=1 Tax=Phenylobacterium sp. TaxID=1871053 RepID=UPI002F94B9DB
MHKRLNGWLAAATAVAGVFLAGEARGAGAVTVLGGGLAEACSEAARAGDRALEDEKTCTLALETEALNPRDRAGTYVNRGVLKLRRLSWDSATADFNQALRIKPDLAEAFVNRGAAAIGARRYAESLPDINRALALGVDEPAKAYYNRALAHEALDDPKSAYFDYQKAIELNPEWGLPKEQLARFTVTRR